MTRVDYNRGSRAMISALATCTGSCSFAALDEGSGRVVGLVLSRPCVQRLNYGVGPWYADSSVIAERLLNVSTPTT